MNTLQADEQSLMVLNLLLVSFMALLQLLPVLFLSALLHIAVAKQSSRNSCILLLITLQSDLMHTAVDHTSVSIAASCLQSQFSIVAHCS